MPTMGMRLRRSAEQHKENEVAAAEYKQVRKPGKALK
jgi:hypothetical protein